jgi:PAS domain S-box-containing protein
VDTVAPDRDWIAKYIYPDDQAHVMLAIQEAVQAKVPFDLEHRVIRANGTIGWTHSRAIPILDGEGNLLEWYGMASDVTERQLNLERIRDAEQRIQLALDAGAVTGTWFWYVKEDRITADARFARSFGMDETALKKGVPLAQAVQSIHPEDESMVMSLIRQALATGGHYRAEYRVRQTNGEYRWIEANGKVIVDEQGCAVNFPGVLIDIHQRKLTELRQAALLQLGDKLRSLEDAREIAFIAAEIAGRALGVIRAGYGTIDPIRGTVDMQPDWRTEPDVVTVEGLHEFADYGSYIGELKAGRAIAIADVRSDPRTSSSAESWATLDVVALLNVPLMDGGGLAGVFLAHHNQPREWMQDEIAFVQGVADRTWAAITRAAAMRALQRMNENLEQLAAERTADRNRLWQLSNALMVLTDGEGVITAVNPAWQDTLGWSENDLIGVLYHDLIHPEDKAGSIKADDRVRKDGAMLPKFENRYRHRDGSYRWISWTAAPGEGYVIGVGHDITEEKMQAEALLRAEEQLRQSQKMEAVGQLTGGLAHDFNNLLVGISGNLEMISILISQGRLDDLQRFIQSAQDSSARAAALTHRLLAFSRRQTLAPKSTSANRLINDMQELIEHTIGPAVTLEMAMAAELWSIFIDPPQLETALLNLCINARDAMPDGGHLKIETRNEWMDAEEAASHDLPPGSYVHLCVTDTGTGMPPEVIAKAFDPFYTTKPIGQGTGLGLSMVYGFARQSGGHVRIHSAVGKGTSICIYLPRHHADEAVTEKISGLPNPVRAKNELTVLVVDDEPAVRLSITELLKELGYIVLEAAAGAEGLSLLQSDARIDLLVTDVGLSGGMNGRQLADAAHGGRPDLKVLFITGYAEAVITGENNLRPGMQIMVKPFSLEKFASRVSEMLAHT